VASVVGTTYGATPFWDGQTWLPARPSYMVDLRSKIGDNSYTILKMTAAQVNRGSCECHLVTPCHQHGTYRFHQPRITSILAHRELKCRKICTTWLARTHTWDTQGAVNS
jgi:hypothetical protein